MVFNWDSFPKDDFVDYCARMENGLLGDGAYIGCVRIGTLCFDLVLREYINRNNTKEYSLDYDLYIGGIDSGYGYASTTRYPYSYDGGGSFESLMIDLTYEQFKDNVERALTDFIMNEGSEHNISLVEEANKPIKIW